MADEQWDSDGQGPIALLLWPGAAFPAEPVRQIGIYVQPFYEAARAPGGKPQVAVGKQYNDLLGSTRREDILAARDMVVAKPALVTPMTMMVLAIRLYDVGPCVTMRCSGSTLPRSATS